MSLFGRTRGLVALGSALRPRLLLSGVRARDFRVNAAVQDQNKGWFYEAKMLFSAQARIDRRKRLQEEITRGRFWELNQIKDNGGKLFECNQELIPSKEAVAAPNLSGFSLSGESTELSKLLAGKTSLVTVCVRDIARPMIAGWVDPVLEQYRDNPGVQVVHLSFVEGRIYSLFKGMFLKSLARALPEEQRGAALVAFGDSEEFRGAVEMHNRLVALVLLVDPNGRVRWRGVGYVQAHEKKALLRCIADLLPN